MFGQRLWKLSKEELTVMNRNKKCWLQVITHTHIHENKLNLIFNQQYTTRRRRHSSAHFPYKGLFNLILKWYNQTLCLPHTEELALASQGFCLFTSSEDLRKALLPWPPRFCLSAKPGNTCKVDQTSIQFLQEQSNFRRGSRKGAGRREQPWVVLDLRSWVLGQ